MQATIQNTLYIYRERERERDLKDINIYIYVHEHINNLCNLHTFVLSLKRKKKKR